MSKIIPIDENIDIFSLKIGDAILRKIPAKNFVNFGIICQIKTHDGSFITATIIWHEDRWNAREVCIDYHFCYNFSKYVIIPS